MKKKGQIYVLAAIVLLIAAISVLVYLNKPGSELVAGEIAVVKDGEVLHIFTMDEISNMPYIEQYKEIVSANFAGEKGVYRGVPLRQLLNAVDESLLMGSARIIARAEDAFVTVYSCEEVNSDDGIFVAYMRDGESLGTLSGGGTGPFRIIILGDEFGNRSIKYLAELEVN